ncbi:MAG: hypothetical protein ACLVEJ_27985 [Parabacteroides sp.]
MKRVVYLLIVCLFPLLASAQWKTIEKSSKKRPAWVGGAERNYLIVSTEAATIEEAKEKNTGQYQTTDRRYGCHQNRIDNNDRTERNDHRQRIGLYGKRIFLHPLQARQYSFYQRSIFI